jgi:hypothetical protein
MVFAFQPSALIPFPFGFLPAPYYAAFSFLFFPFFFSLLVVLGLIQKTKAHPRRKAGFAFLITN